MRSFPTPARANCSAVTRPTLPTHALVTSARDSSSAASEFCHSSNRGSLSPAEARSNAEVSGGGTSVKVARAIVILRQKLISLFAPGNRPLAIRALRDRRGAIKLLAVMDDRLTGAAVDRVAGIEG